MQEQGDETAKAVSDAAPDAAQLTDAERELLRFVRTLTLTPANTADEDVERLRREGWSDLQIAEAVYITALFAFFNRVADAFGLAAPDLAAYHRAEEMRRSQPQSAEQEGHVASPMAAGGTSEHTSSDAGNQPTEWSND